MDGVFDRDALAEALEVSGIGLWRYDLASGRLDWDAHTRRLYGVAADAALGFETFVAGLHEDDRAAVLSTVERSVGEGTEFRVEHRVRTPEGEVRWLLGYGRVRHGPDGTPVEIVGTTRDITVRKRAEAELQESERRLREMAEAMPQLVWRAAPDGSVGYYNSRVGAYRGATRTEGGEWRWEALVHPDEITKTREAWTGAVADQTEYQCLHRLQMADGSWRWHLSRAIPVRETGRIVRWIGTATDIHETIVAEERLRDQELRLRLATEAARMFSFEHDLADGRTTWSENTAAVIGCPAERVGPDPSIAFFAVPEDRAALEEQLAAALATGGDLIKAELTGLCGKAFLLHGRICHGRDGRAERILGVAQDVTDEKSTERALAETARSLARERDRLSIALLTGRLGVYEWKVGEEAAWWSPETYPLYGVGPDDFTPTLAAIDALVHPDDRAELWQLTDRSLRERTVFAHEYRVVHPDGQVRWIANRSHVMLGESGAVEGIVGVALDITERKLHEQQVDHLLREVNHRSKNMLAIVQAIARQTAAGDPADFVERFEQRIQSLSVAQDLVIKGDWKHVTMSDLVRAQVGHFAGVIGSRIRLDGPSVAVTPSAAQALGMAIHELATNAAKYGSLSNEGGTVAVEWRLALDQGVRRFRIAWREQGGPAVTAPTRKGFGSRVIETMVRASLRAKVAVAFEPEGLTWTADCEAAAVLAGPAPAPAPEAEAG